MLYQLYQLRELSDLFADACVRDESGRLMFLSIHGRDTAVQQLLAALTLRVTEGGFDTIHLRDGEERDHVVHVGDVDRLEKFSGRLPKENLFGNLVHLWLYDTAITRPDRSNRVAWVLVERGRDEADPLDTIRDRVWDLYKLLSPVPLLDAWKTAVLSRTWEEAVTLLEETAYPPLGRIGAARIGLPESFPETVSAMVKAGDLALERVAIAA